jgi:uncharacterized membrane protein
MRPFEQALLSQVMDGDPLVRLTADTLTPKLLDSYTEHLRKSLKEDLQKLGILGTDRKDQLLPFVGASLASVVALVHFGAPLLSALAFSMGSLLLVASRFPAYLRGTSTALTGLGFAVRWRLEGFKRLLDESENYHALAAANKDAMRMYMGYVVAVGAVDKWTQGFAAIAQSDSKHVAPQALYMNTAYLASFKTITRSAARAGRSGAGRSGGGGRGGGRGGGGGGSW